MLTCLGQDKHCTSHPQLLEQNLGSGFLLTSLLYMYCNYNYDNLYSIVSSKPHLACSIHPSNVPWVHHPLVSNAHLTFIFHVSLSCTFLFRMYISLLHHSFISSSHSLFGIPLFVFPSISSNTTSFTSLLLYRTVKCKCNI